MGVVCLLERGSGWRPRTLGCSSAAEAKPVERGTDADDELAVERVVRVVEVKRTSSPRQVTHRQRQRPEEQSPRWA